MLKVVSFGDLTFEPNYRAGLSPGTEWGLPPVRVREVPRTEAWPLVTAIERPAPRITLVIRIVGSNITSLRNALLRAFSPEDETPKRLVISDPNGANPRYILAICESLQPVRAGDTSAIDTFVAQLVPHGDIRWRSVTPTQDVWNISASGQTRNITNPGSEDAYPVFYIKPTQAKTGGYGYRRWVAVVWRSQNGGNRYPVRFDLNTQALIGAGKMQADGDDLRVLVNGVERDRWLADLNTTATKIWVNLDFQPSIPMTLKTAIPSSGTISSIEVNESIERMPESGILLIDSEAFVYSGKVNSERKFINITRAARGTAQAAHSVGTPVHWVQHDIWILYGNPNVDAPVTDDRCKPAFDLSQSSNTQWVYEVFNDATEQRAGGWYRYGNITLTGRGGVYTATERTLSPNNFEVIGAWLGESHSGAYGWGLYNPCGITGITWGNGKKRRAGERFLVHCMNWPRGASWWNWHYNPPPPSQPNTWESWSYSGSFSVSDYIAIAAYFFPQDVEAGSATVSLNSSETPLVTVGSELGGYFLDCIISNQTTGESIRVTATLALNQTLIVDCDSMTVKLEDGTRMLSALQILGPPRRQWMRLVPGTNTLQFTDPGTTGVRLETYFEPRWF